MRLAAHRAGKPTGEVERVYPPNSLGEAFTRFKKTATWAEKKPRTREDWERGWKLIETCSATSRATSRSRTSTSGTAAIQTIRRSKVYCRASACARHTAR